MDYKFSLEKNSKKHICPSCNKKRYVRYVNTETNEYLDYNYGRCDRESSCGYFKKPTENSVLTIQKPIIVKKHKISTINKSIVKASLKCYNNNNLYLYLIKYFDEKKVIDVFNKYYVGTSKKWNGATVFWQADKNSKFRSGSIMLYGSNGKRVKFPKVYITYIHSALKITNFNYERCLFGLHLVQNKTKTIGLVESEKTAIVMALFLPNIVWLATSGKGNFKESLLSPIKNCKIIAYPDKSEYEDWNKTCEVLSAKGFNLKCSDLVEKSTLLKGSDLADIYFELKNKNSKNIPLTFSEKIYQKFYTKNPNIKNLIEVFGLTDVGWNNIRTDLVE